MVALGDRSCPRGWHESVAPIGVAIVIAIGYPKVVLCSLLSMCLSAGEIHALAIGRVFQGPQVSESLALLFLLPSIITIRTSVRGARSLRGKLLVVAAMLVPLLLLVTSAYMRRRLWSQFVGEM